MNQQCKQCLFRIAIAEAGENPIRLSIFDPTYIDACLDEFYLDPKKNQAPAFVYFVSDSEFIKIGVADNLKRRLKEIQMGNPRRCEIVAAFPCKSKSAAHQAEGLLHSIYRDYRMNGEWFNILGQCGSLIKVNSPDIWLEGATP